MGPSSKTLDISRMISNELMHRAEEDSYSSSTPEDVVSIFNNIQEKWREFFKQKTTAFLITNAETEDETSGKLFCLRINKDSWEFTRKSDVSKNFYKFDFESNMLTKNDVLSQALLKDFSEMVLKVIRSAQNNKSQLLEVSK